MINERIDEVNKKLRGHKEKIKKILNDNGSKTRAVNFKPLIEEMEDFTNSRTKEIERLKEIEKEYNKLIEIGTLEYLRLFNSL